ncbi:hypothetical protein BGZ60DRAFT_516758 [Tricladium varicosporioides]|nr:hypothetical protein BGZ60DRAFT_516758 [Hymenoscyphus varicosporioides]
MATPMYPNLSTLSSFLAQSFDFIVVGGGTAGLVVAARLTENPDIVVGVLEAGLSHFGDPLVLTPAAYAKSIGDERYDWRFKTVVQWAALVPNSGWDFASLLPYFRKHEAFTDPQTYSSESNLPHKTLYDTKYHGSTGPIKTSFSTYRLQIEEDWITAASSFGGTWGSPADGWSGDHQGSFHGLSTVDRSQGDGFGTRSYAVTGYLFPNSQRKNLHVLTEALVTKLTLLDDNSAVNGVSFYHSGKEHTLTIKKEIILAAGVIKSPQILELSGIGNPEILSKAGVECKVKNLQVGEHLQDHAAVALVYELVDGETSMDIFQDEAKAGEAMKIYMTDRSGPMSTGSSAHCFASFAALSTPEEIKEIQDTILGADASKSPLPPKAKELLAKGMGDEKDANLQIVLLPASINPDGIHDQQLLMKPSPEMAGKMGISFGGCTTRPLSVGWVHLKSKNPEEDPEIDPRYLMHPADALLLAKSVELIERMVSTSPLKEKIKRRACPSPDKFDLGTKEGRLEFVKRYTGTEYHPIGSLAMGREGEGAVDGKLRVYGVKGVRVVDASVMPLHVGGNIVSSVYAVAEKAADLVKEDWGL